MKEESADLHFTIRESWDGGSRADGTEIKLTFSRRRSGLDFGLRSESTSVSATAATSSDPPLEESSPLTGKEDADGGADDVGLVIRVDAPFFDEPRVPGTIPEGSVDKLWEYEVVEVFLLGIDNKYLEIELAPRGHYLLLLLDGHGNILQYQLPLKSYRTTAIEGNRWVGEAIIPYDYLPTPITSFNAYAIHKSPPHRQYMALFPTPPHKYEAPNFHRLKYFQPIHLNQLLP